MEASSKWAPATASPYPTSQGPSWEAMFILKPRERGPMEHGLHLEILLHQQRSLGSVFHDSLSHGLELLQ